VFRFLLASAHYDALTIAGVRHVGGDGLLVVVKRLCHDDESFATVRSIRCKCVMSSRSCRRPTKSFLSAVHQELSAYYFHPSRLDSPYRKSGNVRGNGMGSLFWLLRTVRLRPDLSVGIISAHRPHNSYYCTVQQRQRHRVPADGPSLS
jgi:hypothetical protein